MDDTIILRGGSSAYGEEGDDIFIAYSGVCYGGIGNDTITRYGGSGVSYGGEGDDVFNIYSSNAKYFGEEGNDTFNIIGSLSGIVIDGGSGTNNVTGEVGSNTTINVVGANSGSVSLVSGEEQSVMINGINYTVSTPSSAATVIYRINDSGQISFSVNSGSVIIKGDVNKKHNVELGNNVTFYGGNKGDTVTLTGNASIYCGAGNNVINAKNTFNNIYCQNGNNTITAYSYSFIYGGNGVNNVTLIDRCNYVESGSASMNVTLKGSYNTIYGVGGNNTIVSNTGSNNFISGFGDADNAQALSLSKGETKNLTINGINYTVKNTNSKASNALLYTVNPVTGAISFSGVNVNVTGQKDVSHNVKLYGKLLTFYGGDLDDVIEAVGGNQHNIYGGKGNDTIITNVIDGLLSGDEGDDIIIVNGDYVAVRGGSWR